MAVSSLTHAGAGPPAAASPAPPPALQGLSGHRTPRAPATLGRTSRLERPAPRLSSRFLFVLNRKNRLRKHLSPVPVKVKKTGKGVFSTCQGDRGTAAIPRTSRV